MRLTARLVMALVTIVSLAILGDGPAAHAYSHALLDPIDVAEPGAGFDQTNDECADDADCPNPIVPLRSDVPWSALVVAAVLFAIFVFGLRAVKRQRDEGRRSKWPPIG